MIKLDRYLWRELIMPFIIGTGVVVLMFTANLLIALQKQLDLSQVPKLALVQYLVFKVPGYLNLTLPVGMALAAALVTARLSRETELTAMRSAGASLIRILVPVMMFGALVGVGDYFVVDRLVPRSETKANSIERQIGVLVAAPSFAENKYIQLNNYQAFIGSLRKVKNRVIELNNIILISRPKPNIDQVITAKSGTYSEGEWVLDHAYIRQFQGAQLIQFKVKKRFPISDRIVVADLYVPPAPEQLSSSQLRKQIALSQSLGQSPQVLEVQLETRFSVPFACIIFAFLSSVLAILFSKMGGFAGILVSILVVDLYWNAYVISTDILGKNGTLSPILAAWLPNILFLIIGIVALKRIE